MNAKWKKQFAIVLCMLMVLSCTVGTWNVAATTEKNANIVITNIQEHSAACDWSGLVDQYAQEGKYIESFKVTLKTAVSSNVVGENITYTAGDLTLAYPGTNYQLIVEPTYYSYDTNMNKVYATGYEWNEFTTAGTAPVLAATTTQAPTTQAPTTQAPAPVTVETPKITKVQMVNTKVGIAANTVAASGYEYRVCTKKGKVVKSETSSYTATTIYSVPANKVYYAQVRAYAYDANGNKVYSAWSAKKYFVAQPTINTNKSKVNKHSINVKWNKVKNAKNYTVYAKKASASKWIKVATTKKNSYCIKKLKGKTINTLNNTHNVRIVANAKVKGKKIKSDNSKYIDAYTYTYYR